MSLDALLVVKLPPGRWHPLLTGTAKETECTLSPYEVAWLKLRDKPAAAVEGKRGTTGSLNGGIEARN